MSISTNLSKTVNNSILWLVVCLGGILVLSFLVLKPIIKIEHQLKASGFVCGKEYIGSSSEWLDGSHPIKYQDIEYEVSGIKYKITVPLNSINDLNNITVYYERRNPANGQLWKDKITNHRKTIILLVFFIFALIAVLFDLKTGKRIKKLT
ncbi:MAG TPA: hypothetical protein VKF42_01940 [Chitinivibrionales bacterium]|jgi:hypothetical protein|nr:hypothetical protein [Chitinivibrionales bacterium]